MPTGRLYEFAFYMRLFYNDFAENGQNLDKPAISP